MAASTARHLLAAAASLVFCAVAVSAQQCAVANATPTTFTVNSTIYQCPPPTGAASAFEYKYALSFATTDLVFNFTPIGERPAWSRCCTERCIDRRLWA
jgi:hypothetical protein